MGRPVYVPGPTGTKRHEQWHTDGVDNNIYDSASREGFTLDQRPGYRAGARAQAVKFQSDLREFMKTAPTKAQIDQKVDELANEHFFNAGLLRITDPGHWHKASHDNAEYNSWKPK